MLMHAISLDQTETVRKKLDILKTHCRNVNRDYDSILKTKLGVVVIDNDGLMAKKKVQQAFIGMPEAAAERICNLWYSG